MFPALEGGSVTREKGLVGGASVRPEPPEVRVSKQTVHGRKVSEQNTENQVIRWSVDDSAAARGLLTLLSLRGVVHCLLSQCPQNINVMNNN